MAIKYIRLHYVTFTREIISLWDFGRSDKIFKRLHAFTFQLKYTRKYFMTKGRLLSWQITKITCLIQPDLTALKRLIRYSAKSISIWRSD